MDRVADLTTLIQHTIEESAGGTWIGAQPYVVIDLTRHIYAVLAIPNYAHISEAGIVEMASIVGDKIIINIDISDRPLYERLMQQGIPREKIILTYAGESLPDSVPDAP